MLFDLGPKLEKWNNLQCHFITEECALQRDMMCRIKWHNSLVKLIRNINAKAQKKWIAEEM